MKVRLRPGSSCRAFGDATTGIPRHDPAEALVCCYGTAKLFPLLRRHVPAAPVEVAAAFAARCTMAQTTKQNPAQCQQSQRLPETKRPPAEQWRQQPIPQVHHHFAAYEDK